MLQIQLPKGRALKMISSCCGALVRSVYQIPTQPWPDFIECTACGNMLLESEIY